MSVLQADQLNSRHNEQVSLPAHTVPWRAKRALAYNHYNSVRIGWCQCNLNHCYHAKYKILEVFQTFVLRTTTQIVYFASTLPK